MKLEDGLETIGNALTAGFGDQVLMGVFLGFLDNITPYRCYEYIRDNLQLGYQLAETSWAKYQRVAKKANLGSITRDSVVAELREHRPDILGVILNHPEGLKWLDAQIDQMKQKLGLE